MNKLQILSTKEEIFMYLSIIVALISYYLQLNVLVWIFGIKACTEFIASLVYAIKEKRDIWN